jgi:hypothetical protein
VATALASTLLAGCADPDTRFTGIWKTNCEDAWGVQIQPAGEGLYAVTFCGVSGCLVPREWTPDTRIEGDPMYRVVSRTRIDIRRNDGGYFAYRRCSADPSWAAASS